MQSFAIDKKNGEVLFVVKDGTIGVGPITWASVVCHHLVLINTRSPDQLTSGVRGDVTICSTELRTFNPNTGSPEGKRSRQDSNNDDLAHDSSSQSSDVESIRTNRFQLPPTRLSDLVNESRASRSRSLSRTAPGSQHKDGKPHISGPVGEDGEWREDGMDFGPDGLRKVLRDDVLYIMRRRAEEGYGVVNVSFSPMAE